MRIPKEEKQKEGMEIYFTVCCPCMFGEVEGDWRTDSSNNFPKFSFFLPVKHQIAQEFSEKIPAQHFGHGQMCCNGMSCTTVLASSLKC
jgi:hypothetical protein